MGERERACHGMFVELRGQSFTSFVTLSPLFASMHTVSQSMNFQAFLAFSLTITTSRLYVCDVKSGFTWLWGIQRQFLMLVQQALYPLSSFTIPFNDF